MMIFLLRSRRISLLFVLALLVVLLWFWFIWPDNFSWTGYHNISGDDLSQHISGWNVFVYEPWHFPLLKIDSFDYPTGTTISATDSIPLLAVFFKLFRFLLPPGFNYFSWIFIFVFMLQALAATTLAISLNQKNILAVIIFTLFAMSAPIALSRLAGEDSLAWHCFILFALSLYFFNRNQQLSLFRLNLYFGLIIGLSLLVHPYITAMSYPFYLASLYEYYKCNAAFKKTLCSAFLTHLAIGFEIFIFGLYTKAAIIGGFGWETMNLLSPFYGGRFAHGSIIAYPEQAEGFAYLGLGLIFTLILALFFTWGCFKSGLKQYRSLIIIGILFFVYSIDGSIYLGHIKIVHYGVPHFFLTYDFRTAGRFFWPCTYIFMCFALVTLLKKGGVIGCILLPLLLALQLFDLSPYIIGLKKNLESVLSIQPVSIQSKEIMAKMAQSKIIIYYPKMNCEHQTRAEYHRLVYIQLLASVTHTLINNVYTAHIADNVPVAECGDDSPKFTSLSPKLLISAVSRPSPTSLQLLKTDPSACQIIDQAYYCKLDSAGHK